MLGVQTNTVTHTDVIFMVCIYIYIYYTDEKQPLQLWKNWGERICINKKNEDDDGAV